MTARRLPSWLFPVVLLAFSISACNSSSSGGSAPPSSLSITLSTSMVLAPQDGTVGSVNVTVTGASSAVTLSTSGLPNGLTVTYTQPGTTGSGAISFAASPNSPSGTYAVSVTATAGSSSGSQPLSLVVAVSDVVSSSTDTSLGVNGKLQQFMATSFQPAEWDYEFFTNHAQAEPAQLNSLGPQHIRLQGVSQAVPWVANSNPQQATDWNFTMLDAIVQPVLSVTDHSPEFQVAVTPSFFSLTSPLSPSDANLQLFVSYCQNLVRYYNTGGFTWGGTTFKSPSSYTITWWGIYNEYNINGLTPQDYVVLYNAVVPAMLGVDPSIKISALELSDFDSGEGDPRNNLPTFVAAVSAGGVNAPVNVASTHFYSSCDQTDTDTQIFSTVPGFANDVQYFYQEFNGSANPNLSSVAVWVTENNVNADYANSEGNSTCNPSQKFVLDTRGTSAFFAAWRPYVFSQLGKVGNQALYHWDYDADAQYSEVDYTSGNKYLSYWVDYTLGQLFPVTPTSAPNILSLNTTETSAVESLATQNPDGSFTVMVADHAVHSASDNNGPGDPRTVIVDVSALGNISSISQITLDTNTNISNGPQPVSVTPGSKVSVTLNGYGATFLHLIP